MKSSNPRVYDTLFRPSACVSCQEIILFMNSLLNTLISDGRNTLIYSNKCFQLPLKQSIIVTPTKELAIQTYSQYRQFDPTLRITRFGSIPSVAPIVHLISDKEAKSRPDFDVYRTKVYLQSVANAFSWNYWDLIVCTPIALEQFVRKSPLPCQTLFIEEADLIINDPSMNKSLGTIVRKTEAKQLILASSVSKIDQALLPKDTVVIMEKSYMKLDATPGRFKFYREIEDLEFGKKTLLFVDCQERCEQVSKLVPDSLAYHSGLTVEERIGAIERFHQESARTLVATQLGSRRLEFPKLERICIHNLPDTYEQLYLYLSRARDPATEIYIRLPDSEASSHFNQLLTTPVAQIKPNYYI